MFISLVTPIAGAAALRSTDINLIELNEAFATHVIACDRDLNFDPSGLM
jgi:acetyl-CoA acetyltransferase